MSSPSAVKTTLLLVAALTLSAVAYQELTVTDYDGNVYTTITIGTQTWLKENLRTTHFRNGVAIPRVTAAWGGISTPAYCAYNNEDANSVTYGYLYNWYAVADSNNLCPAGWHVPTDLEFDALAAHLGGMSVAGGKLKEAGLVHWSSPNTGADNSSGFTALPGGNRSFDYNGAFGGLRERGHWWSSSEYNLTLALHRSLYYNSTNFPSVINGYMKQSGFAVRCVRDAPPSFTDDPLIVGVTSVNAVHVTELRQRIDDLRTRSGMTVFGWTDPNLAATMPIEAVHLTELRTALNAVYTAAGQAAPTYTHVIITGGETVVTAVDIAELRAAVLAIW